MQEIATFGAGCFWGIEVAFRKVPGVLDAAVGYSGGKTRESHVSRRLHRYHRACRGGAGHV